MLPVFELIEKHGKVDNTEMHQVFNMGIGMTAIVSGSNADSVRAASAAAVTMLGSSAK